MSRRDKSSKKKSTNLNRLPALPSAPMTQDINGDVSTKLAALATEEGGDDISANVKREKTLMRKMRDFFANKAEELAYNVVAYG